MSSLLVLLPAVGPCGGNPDCVVQPFDNATDSGLPLGLIAMVAVVVLLGLVLLRVQRREARDLEDDPERREDDAG
jgi:hypothetical protein